MFFTIRLFFLKHSIFFMMLYQDIMILLEEFFLSGLLNVLLLFWIVLSYFFMYVEYYFFLFFYYYLMLHLKQYHFKSSQMCTPSPQIYGLLTIMVIKLWSLWSYDHKFESTLQTFVRTSLQKYMIKNNIFTYSQRAYENK